MAKTNPEAPRHQQFSTFIVELPNPGYRIIRDIKTMSAESELSHILGGGHAEVEIKNLVVSADNLLGGEGNGFGMGQHRLAYGRLRHGMHNVAMAQRALDLAAAHITKRETFGKKLADRQAVQFMMAECASQLYIARLMLLHIAYKAEKGLDLRQENGIAKVYLAHMVHHVVDTAIQLHGALGALQVGHQHRGAQAGQSLGKGQQFGGVGQLRQQARRHKRADLDLAQAAGHQRIKPALLVGRGHGGFDRLQAVTRADFADQNFRGIQHVETELCRVVQG